MTLHAFRFVVRSQRGTTVGTNTSNFCRGSGVRDCFLIHADFDRAEIDFKKGTQAYKSQHHILQATPVKMYPHYASKRINNLDSSRRKSS